LLRTTIHRNRRILATTVRGVGRGLVTRRAEFRHHVVRDAWTLAKRFGAEGVENIELREIPCLRAAIAEGYVDDQQRLLLAALCAGLGCRTFFEIGTNRGRTAWTVARSNPEILVHTLDVPLDAGGEAPVFALASDDKKFFRGESWCGEAFRDTPEATRITQHWDDSARFDFSPLAGSIDFVYVDGAHTYDYVASDTENALGMLSDTGTIAWDDYASNPDVYRLVNERARALDGPVFHIFGTRMAIHSRQPFVERLPPDDHASIPTI
jgi:hypothetical protein